jgi:hypothetical protein
VTIRTLVWVAAPLRYQPEKTDDVAAAMVRREQGRSRRRRAGYSKTTPENGLRVYMPDVNKLRPTQKLGTKKP